MEDSPDSCERYMGVRRVAQKQFQKHEFGGSHEMAPKMFNTSGGGDVRGNVDLYWGYC